MQFMLHCQCYIMHEPMNRDEQRKKSKHKSQHNFVTLNPAILQLNIRVCKFPRDTLISTYTKKKSPDPDTSNLLPSCANLLKPKVINIKLSSFFIKNHLTKNSLRHFCRMKLLSLIVTKNTIFSDLYSEYVYMFSPYTLNS